jgi:small subunit ribosomal protein S17
MTKVTAVKERRKVMIGRVVSGKTPKTVVVEVEQRRSHPLYGKVVTHARRFKAHNEEPQAKLGDLVKIVESRPLSREKRWRVTEIVQRGEVVEQIYEKELQELHAKEEAERAARRAEEERRAAERLAKLAGESEETAEAAAELAESHALSAGEGEAA